MYVVFGDRVVDSQEMKVSIEENSEFKIIKDMSKGSKREDIIAYNLSISIDRLKQVMKEDEGIQDALKEELTEEELFEEYLTLAEEYAADIEEVVPEGAILDIRAYKWDESDNDIKLVIVIAHEEIGEHKLKDVMKNLIRQVE